MLVPTDNDISIKEYYKISNYKDNKIEIEKIVALDNKEGPAYKKKINTSTRYLAIPAHRKYKNMHSAELPISLGEYYQCI